MLFSYFRLSDKAIRDQKRYANEAPKAIETLYERLNHFASRDDFLVSTRNPANSPYSIKRLKCKTMAWRHRCHDNHRTVFTLSEYENQITVVILRSAPRAEVYKGLEKYLTIDKKNLDDWRRIASDELQNEDDILDNNVPSENQIISIFTNQGGNDNFYVEKSRLRIHQLKGAAGTGKTTSIFQLAYESIDNNVYPIIIVPNQSIQNYGIKYFGELPEKKLICNSLDRLKKSDELPNYDLAILTREHLLQHLAGDSQEAFSSMVGNIKIRQILTERRVNIPKSSENINLYNLYLGINSEAYNQSDKDIILRELEESETYKFMIDRNHQSLVQQAFQGLQGRDTITQTERIKNNSYKFLDVMSRILGNDSDRIKSPVLMIDEVQDFYWCQLKVILDFYQTCFPMSSQIENATLFSSDNSGLQITARAIAKDAGRLVVIAGDNNQRVTFSGFSWANFATSFRRDFPNNDQDSLFALENPFNINYRNTHEINLAANYLLSAQRTDIKAFRIDDFSGISWIDTPPSDSKRKKFKPQLIEINEHLIEKFTIQIGELKEKKQLGEDKKLVFIKTQTSNDNLLFWEQIKSDQYPHLVSMTIAEAKGQEFESVLIAFPFSDCPEKIFVKNLFIWYTAITRAKNYVGIIISSKERSWLESNVINLDDLNKIFDEISLSKEKELSDFIKQLSRFGFHRMTDEQSKLEKVRHIFKQIQIFLQQGILKSSLVNKEEEVWDLLDTIISQQDYREQYFSSGLDQIREKQALENISQLGLGAVLTFYVAVLPLLIEIDNYTHAIKEIDLILMNKLNFYFQEGEEDKITAFENIKNPICLCLLYRGNRKFWKAAQQLREQSGTETPNAKLITDFLYKQINDDYIRNGLPWSASRFRYHFLKEKPNELLPFSDLLKESSDDDHIFGSLVPHLIGEIQDFSSNLKKEFSNE